MNKFPFLVAITAHGTHHILKPLEMKFGENEADVFDQVEQELGYIGHLDVYLGQLDRIFMNRMEVPAKQEIRIMGEPAEAFSFLVLIGEPNAPRTLDTYRGTSVDEVKIKAQQDYPTERLWIHQIGPCLLEVSPLKGAPVWTRNVRDQSHFGETK